MGSIVPERTWVTLLTQASYLPGVITLAHSLRTHGTVYPFLVLVTPSVPNSSLRALEAESLDNPLLQVHHIEALHPDHQTPSNSVAARFADTWSKLRAFSLTSYETCVFLDADLTVYSNMDELFDIDLPRCWIAANHACVCNLDHDKWAPDNWTKANCAYTPLSHPSALQSAGAIPPDARPPNTYALLNSGMFVYHPNPQLWSDMLEYLHSHSALLSTFQFPDQDFLAHYFAGRWLSLSWKYNALKTMENWHTNIWRDAEVKGLHYIVDKPWQKRIASDGVAGHLGRDGKTHGWWWQVWDEWKGSKNAGSEVVQVVEKEVAAPLDKAADRKQVEENRGKGLPIPIPNIKVFQGPGKEDFEVIVTEHEVAESPEAEVE